MAPPTYKLTYFNFRGLAESSRLVFAYTGVAYEDVRLDNTDWPERKANYQLPWGTLPTLEVDGKILAQSGAILRYLGKQFNLMGENEFDAAKCDEIVEAHTDLRTTVIKYFHETDENKKEELKTSLLNDTFPKYLGKFNEILKQNNGFFVGKKFCCADFAVANFLEGLKNLYPDLLDKYSALKAHQEAVFNAPGIQEWVANRPVTAF